MKTIKTIYTTGRRAQALCLPVLRTALLGLAVTALFLSAGCSSSEDDDTSGPEPNSVRVSSSSGRMPSGGVLEAQYSDAPTGCGVAQIVDGNNNSKFVTSHSSFYLLWTGNESVAVNYYAITSAADAPEKDPAAWTLSGSSDNETWTVLDAQQKQTFATRKEKKEYELANTRAFRYLKLEVTGNNGGATTQIAELTVQKFKLDIDDLMQYASGNSYSNSTPMGNHYADGRHETTAADKTWLADASNEPKNLYDNNWTWKEFSVQLYPMAGVPSPADANQHGIGDCSAIAVFGSMAYIYPDFIKAIIKDNGNKTYTVAMFDPQGKAVDVTVSSKFLANANGDIQSVSGKNNIACWSSVLEKAMMKWNAIYKYNENVTGIGSEHVAPLFTGNGDSFAFSSNVLDNEQLARAVKISLMQGKIVVGGFTESDRPVDGYKTVSGHAWTLMHSSNAQALFAMRNPWGANYPVGGGINGDKDGVVNIPNNQDIPPLIDLRIIDPGKAADYGSGVKDPYTPPVFAPQVLRIAPYLLQSGL